MQCWALSLEPQHYYFILYSHISFSLYNSNQAVIYSYSDKSKLQTLRYIIIMVSCKQLFVNWLVLSHDLAGRFASAHRVYLGGSSTKDDGGKHLRALPAPNQEGIEDMFLGSSTSKNPVEVPVSDILFDIFLYINSH